MAAKRGNTRSEDLPGTFKDFVTKWSALGEAHEQIARAVDAAGPLDRKTCELIKIGLSLGAGLETAVRSHTRRAMQNGASEAEIVQAVLLSYNTCGWPRMVAGWKWVQEQLKRGI